MEAAADAVATSAAAVVGPRGWKNPVLPPGATVLSESPIAFTIDNFMTDEECDHLIEVGTPLMKRALVSGDAKGEVSNVRTNSVGWVPAAGDAVLEGIEDRICALFGASSECTENFQVCRVLHPHPRDSPCPHRRPLLTAGHSL